MTEPSRLISSEEPEQQIFEGKINNDAEASVDDVFVSLPDFETKRLQHGPCPWTAVIKGDGVYYPKKGDPCVVVVPDPANEFMWIVAWTPNSKAKPDVAF